MTLSRGRAGEDSRI